MGAEPANGSPSLGASRTRIELQAGGAFSFDGVQPGQYFLRLTGSSWAIKSITHGGRDYTYVPLEASAGRDFNDVIVTMIEKAGALAGSVRDRNGAAATAAAVMAFPAEREQWTHFGFSPPRFKSAQTRAREPFRSAACRAASTSCWPSTSRSQTRGRIPPSSSAPRRWLRAWRSVGATRRTVDLVIARIR